MMEQVLVDNMAGFLKQRAADEQPFFMYYAPYAIHKKQVQAAAATRHCARHSNGMVHCTAAR
jgi:hypothetical protein